MFVHKHYTQIPCWSIPSSWRILHDVNISRFFRQCYEWMLHKAKSMDWSEDSAKALVVIGDAPPHPPSYTDQNINWWDEVELLKGMGVKVNGGHLYVRGVIKTFVDWCDKSNTM